VVSSANTESGSIARASPGAAYAASFAGVPTQAAKAIITAGDRPLECGIEP
jgi:hypothetical protein